MRLSSVRTGCAQGYLTETARRGIALVEAMQQSQHRSVQQATRYYNEVIDLKADPFVSGDELEGWVDEVGASGQGPLNPAAAGQGSEAEASAL